MRWLALLFLGADEFGAASQERQGLRVEGPEQGILEPVPQLVAGGLRIRKRVQREQDQGFRRFHLCAETPDDGRVFTVSANEFESMIGFKPMAGFGEPK